MKKSILIITFLFTLIISSNGQIINTFAGIGTCCVGPNGDGGSATNAQLSLPEATATDALGNVFIVDIANSQIRKVSPSGIISTFAGTGLAGYGGDGGAANLAQLNYPRGVAVDASGNVFITDAGNNRVRKVNTAGVISTYAGTGVSGYTGNGGLAVNAQLSGLMGITIDILGNMYIVETGRVRKINTAGVISAFAGVGSWSYGGDGGPAINAQFNLPWGIAVDLFGNVYIGEAYNNRIRKIDTSGIISTFAGTGVSGYIGDGGAAINAQLASPCGVAVDALGNVFVADYNNSRVRKINTAGIISTFAGTGVNGFSGDGGLSTNAQLYAPRGVQVDASGNLFIADETNGRVRKVTCPAPMITATSPSPACSGNMGCLSASGASTYLWTGPCGFSSNQQSPCFPFYTFCSCNYTVTGTDANGCKNTATVCLNVNTLPTLTATTSDSLLCSGQTATLAVSGANTYTWNTGGYGTSIVVTPTTTTNYIVNGTDANGCTNNALVTQSVSICTTVSEFSSLNSRVTIYPNPSTGIFNLELNETTQIIITNVLGQEILNEKLPVGKQSIDIQSQPAGIYFYKLIAEKKYSGKLIKQ